MKNLRFFGNRQATPQNPCGLAIDQRNGQVVIAEFANDGGLDIYRAMIDERRAVNISTADIRTTLTGGNAHTDQLQAPVTANDDDETILRELLSLTEDDPHAFNFTRTPDGRVLTTQVDQNAVNDIAHQTETWLQQQRAEHVRLPDPILRVETRTRAIARVWNAGNQTPETGTVAFLILSGNDYALGLWSENTSLVYETEERFESGADTEIKCQHARDMFCKLIAAHTVENLRLPAVTKAIVSAPDDYAPIILEVLRSTEELGEVSVNPISLDLGQSEPSILDQPTAFAIGALLDDPSLPSCDLNVSVSERLEEIKRTADTHDRSANASKVMAASVALLAPLVAVVAFMFTCWADHAVERARLQSRSNQEDKAATQLAKDNADYESSKASFGAFKTLLDNLIALRQRQPATHQLLRDLNQRWPQDPTWYISELNVKGGSIEIKGKTKSEQAITSFAKSLEFSDGLFTGILTKNNVQGNSTNPTPQAATPQSNIIEFTVLATYAPLADPGKPAPSSKTAQTQPPPAIPLMNNSSMPRPSPTGMPMPGRLPMTVPTPSSMPTQQSGATK